jgi:hypothetical protein
MEILINMGIGSGGKWYWRYYFWKKFLFQSSIPMALVLKYESTINYFENLKYRHIKTQWIQNRNIKFLFLIKRKTCKFRSGRSWW